VIQSPLSRAKTSALFAGIVTPADKWQNWPKHPGEERSSAIDFGKKVSSCHESSAYFYEVDGLVAKTHCGRPIARSVCGGPDFDQRAIPWPCFAVKYGMYYFELRLSPHRQDLHDQATGDECCDIAVSKWISVADLSTIKGIGGILSSTGQYEGTLGGIAVHGETSTPDFQIAISGRPVPLYTKFHAIVDGMTGDTYLQPVEAKILNSSLVAKGSVVKVQNPNGHRVVLDVRVEPAKIEDLLRLGVRTDPPVMTGKS